MGGTRAGVRGQFFNEKLSGKHVFSVPSAGRQRDRTLSRDSISPRST
jgi:hypothetical protein